MRKVEIGGDGAPEEVARCVKAEDVGAPGSRDIVFDVLAFPINPADLSMCRGNYRLRDGVLAAAIASTYPIEEITAALVHAQKGGRHGKILVLPNGPI